MDKNEKTQVTLTDEGALYTDVCGIIDGARGRLATYINAEICMTNWYVGKRIKVDVLDNQRASYDKQVVKNLAVKLTAKYGNGWGYEKLKQCIRCSDLFSKDEIGYAVRTQLSWTQLRSLMGLKERKAWEESPIGLILCSEGNTEHIQYLMLDENSQVKVAQYYTQLPDKAVLAEKLKKAVAIAEDHYRERKN